MYIRLRANKSGTTTVYLLDSIRLEGKKHASSKVVKCFGSSANQDQIDQWVGEAELLKAQLSGQKINVRQFTTIRQPNDIKSCCVEELGVRYLYSHLYRSIFAKLKLKGVNTQMLMDLAIMRIVMPVSKLRTANISSHYGINGMSANKIYKLMDALTDNSIEVIKKHVLANTKLLVGGSIQVMFYDLTTIYFENNSQTELKEFGFSKDGKSQHVQISMALIVTEQGMPISYEIFKGNTFEGSTLIPTLEKLKSKYGVQDITVVADSAMLSDSNIKALIEQQYKFIVSARVRNMKQSITKQILDSSYYKEAESLKYKSIELDDNQMLVSAFSEERRCKDEYDRNKAIERIKKLEGKCSKSGLRGGIKKSYITVDKDSIIQLDEGKIEASKKLDGYFGFISNTGLSEESIIAHYKGLWQVEQSFRLTKHNLKIRPVYHSSDRRIKAHFAICYLSLALVRSLEYKLKQVGQYIPIEALHNYLSEIKEVKLNIDNQESSITTDIPREISGIFVALNIKAPKRYNISL